MASIAITDATPKRMPSEVSDARSRLWPTASSAVRKLNVARATNARHRARGPSLLGGATGLHRHGNSRWCIARLRRGDLAPGETHAGDRRGVRRRHEQDLVALREPVGDVDMGVVQRAGRDLLLHDAAAIALEDVRDVVFGAHRLERDRKD